jgi:DNA-binding Lrp family transcriptional regulator
MRQRAARSSACASTMMRLLSDPTTAARSDRKIARRVGVSPQTVGNIPRRTGK